MSKLKRRYPELDDDGDDDDDDEEGECEKKVVRWIEKVAKNLAIG